MKCAAGLTPIKLFLDERNVRAWPGGVGDCKVGSNYAPTIHPQITAHEMHGTPQVCPPARVQPQSQSMSAVALSGEALQPQRLLMYMLPVLDCIALICNHGVLVSRKKGVMLTGFTRSALWNACLEGIAFTLYRHVTAPCLQVLYTMPSSSSSKDDAIVSESGAMNVFFVFDKVEQ